MCLSISPRALPPPREVITMDNSLLGAFFFLPFVPPEQLHAAASARKHRSAPSCWQSFQQNPRLLTPGESHLPFFPIPVRPSSRASWRGECQELSLGFAWGQNCPGAKEKAQKMRALPRPRASRVPEAVIFALFSSLRGSHPSPNPVKRRRGRCMEKAGSAARRPPPCWLLQRLKARWQQKSPVFL